MIMAMCYGAGDFSKTLCMLVQSGWDTDCTAGNVGSIMGALVGVEGIDPKWITPINDVLNASSCVGCLNIQTVSQSATMFAELAMKLQGLKAPEFGHFQLPYATEGFFTDGKAEIKDNSLIVQGTRAWKYAYYLGKDVYDARYDPVYSPTVYPGDKIIFDVEGRAAVYFKDCEGNMYCSPEGTGRIEYRIPVKTNMTIHEYGLIFNDSVVIKNYRIISGAVIDHDFTDYCYDVYGPRYGGDDLGNIRGYVPHSGKWEITSEGLKGSCFDHGLITTGSTDMLVSEMVIQYTGDCLTLIFDAQGYMHFSGIRVSKDNVSLIRKDNEVSVIEQHEITVNKNTENVLKVRIKDGRVSCCLNGVKTDFTNQITREKGITGFLGENCELVIRSFKCK
jgi:hypothetical protein